MLSHRRCEDFLCVDEARDHWFVWKREEGGDGDETVDEEHCLPGSECVVRVDEETVGDEGTYYQSLCILHRIPAEPTGAPRPVIAARRCPNQRHLTDSPVQL